MRAEAQARNEWRSELGKLRENRPHAGNVGVVAIEQVAVGLGNPFEIPVRQIVWIIAEPEIAQATHNLGDDRLDALVLRSHRITVLHPVEQQAANG